MPAPLLVAVLVLYCREAEESEAFRSLLDFAEADPAAPERLHLLVYDNSPEPHVLPGSGFTTTYQHDPANGGLAPAYNAALRIAERVGSDWVLLLDQDTLLNPPYLHELMAFVQGAGEKNLEVVAAVPRLVQQGVVLSPRRRPQLRHRCLAADKPGIADEIITAYNSGAALRVSAMRRAGGFPLAFTLDFLDHAVFHRLQQDGGRIWLMRSALQHQLSTLSLGQGMSLQRYRRMLANERLFFRQRTGTADRFWYKLRLLKRVAGHAVLTRDKRFPLLELQSLLGLPL